MNEAKEILSKWLIERNFSTYKELADFLDVAQNTIDVWKQRGKIPEKNILKYAQLCKNNQHVEKQLISKLESHITDKELEILEAFRSLPKERQESFYHKVKYEAIEYGEQNALKAV